MLCSGHILCSDDGHLISDYIVMVKYYVVVIYYVVMMVIY